MVYLARWGVPLADVEQAYEKQRQALLEVHSDDTSTAQGQDLTVKEVANLFINAKAAGAQSGDLSWITWRNYQNELKWFVKQVGDQIASAMQPTDFAILNQTLQSSFKFKEHERRIATLRMAMRWAYENGFLAAMPRFGTQFRSPGKRKYRKERALKPYKLFSAQEVRTLVDAAEGQMRAMILLGINCAYLQSDLAELPVVFPENSNQCLDLGNDPHIRFDRPKTQERRKCTLWPESVEALKGVIGKRQTGLVFTTRQGQPLIHVHRKIDEHGRVLGATHCDAVAPAFRKLCKRVGLAVTGRGFSALRSTFETRAWHVRRVTAADVAAIHWIMGHTLGGPEVSKMADVYVQDIDNASLKCVTDSVRDWYLHT